MASETAKGVRNLILLEMLKPGTKAWSEVDKTGEPILVELFIPKEVKEFFDEALPLITDKLAELETAIFMELIHNGLGMIAKKMRENKEDVIANLMSVAKAMHDRQDSL